MNQQQKIRHISFKFSILSAGLGCRRDLSANVDHCRALVLGANGDDHDQFAVNLENYYL